MSGMDTGMLPEPTIVNGEVRCPNCGGRDRLSLVADGVKEWRLQEQSAHADSVTLVFNGLYETWDEDENDRLYCKDCGKQFQLPDVADVDFV